MYLGTYLPIYLPTYLCNQHAHQITTSASALKTPDPICGSTLSALSAFTIAMAIALAIVLAISISVSRADGRRDVGMHRATGRVSCAGHQSVEVCKFAGFAGLAGVRLSGWVGVFSIFHVLQSLQGGGVGGLGRRVNRGHVGRRKRRERMDLLGTGTVPTAWTWWRFLPAHLACTVGTYSTVPRNSGEWRGKRKEKHGCAGNTRHSAYRYIQVYCPSPAPRHHPVRLCACWRG